MTDYLKKLLPDAVVIALFALLSFIYFYPADVEHRMLAQHDAVAGVGAGRETQLHEESTGEHTRWTNAIFGGMPTYQMSPSYPSMEPLKFLAEAYHLYLPMYVWYVFIMLLGFYILLRAFDFRAWMAMLGAVIWAFSSYFFIIIAAGHIWKLLTLAYIPPTIAGMVLAYRGRYLSGGLLLAFFTALQIASNHIQMTYYFLFVMLFMAVAYGVSAYREGMLRRYFKASGALVLAGLIGVAINASTLYHTYEYSKESTRGKSELTAQPQEKAETIDDMSSEKAYITAWSYGIGETWSLLVPNVKGGASVPLAQNETAMKKANPEYASIYNQIGQYWGEQPGTSGPVYVGAFVCFLFILGCFVVRTPLKWALVAGTVFSVVLSWGKNFMPVTDFFIDYVPMYSKFRAVSSILVIAEFTVPLLAVLALREFVQRPQEILRDKRALIVSSVFTIGTCLVFALAPGLFFDGFISTTEMQALQGLPKEHIAPVISNLEEMRRGILTADAWRSLIVILIGVALLCAYAKSYIKSTWLVVSLTVLCLADMWTVNKRYLYDELFVEEHVGMRAFLQPTETDKEILKDTTLDYRVLNLAVNTFNENNTAYFHKSIGGYHAAKLRRYQELIEAQIQPEIQNVFGEVSRAAGDMTQVDPSAFSVLNMLNTRYFIFPLQGGATVPLQNPYALGNAWFVDEVKTVNTADAELESLSDFDPRRTAVVREGTKLRPQFADSTAVVTLTNYAPNALTYEISSPKGGVVVFSEIYYPGWQSEIDGKAAPHVRANYVLRAMNVPAGKHVVTFRFDPKSLHITETVAYMALILLLLGAVAWCVSVCRRKKNAVENNH